MSDSPLGRPADPADRRRADGGRYLHLLAAIGLIFVTASAVACDDEPVVEPEPDSIDARVQKLKQNVESFDEKVDETIDRHADDVGVSVDDAAD